jgi:uncharacterized membrane protein
MEITVEDEVRIAAPPDAVWALTQDWRRQPEWNPFVKAVEVESDDPLVVRLTQERGVQATGRATVFDRPHRAQVVLSELRGGGPVHGGESTWEYEDAGDGTTVLRQRTTLEVGGLAGRAAAPIIRRGVEDATTRALARARQLLEAPAG